MADITVDSRLFGLKDVDLHVDDHGGEGRPVVLIHGWPLSGESWSEQIGALTDAGLRVITYDRRGFGRSDKPRTGYDYDSLADDLASLLEALDLRDVSLVGFSMGGGEVARYVARHGEERLRSVVFAAAVPPMMMKGPNNPQGPLEPSEAAEMSAQLTADRGTFFDGFVDQFFAANGEGPVLVTQAQRQDALRLTAMADQLAALEAMQSFGLSDFREDLKLITVPTLVLHGDADGIVPFEGSGRRTHEAVAHSELVLVPGAPHGLNVSHADEFNRALVDFLTR
ncbi:alpha/beta hydrolase [Aeromicrobium tamlense]|uniref:Alpha/beta hydrolase n=1 Tax=Aeromicrobium tamlense TaxID=375541 RepID=A0A8I0FYY7_9ACTN|nr:MULTISPECIES: alpha/beta hydrolase [Aeromicrobium]MBD1270710.1 alpha/beta hydrolase [Aeromicrobium tamlense]MBD1271158.1 alpha/beta hydrolase [Aeromicrobium tamlense]NYI38102.1 pimeloyl-ACP methyl ester carboxylesterase [Aeromicrobium tamlense]